MFRLLHSFSRFEALALAVFVFFFLVSLGMLLRRFYKDNSILVPAKGGTYIEGSVGELQPLIPWFTVRNDVNRDIVSLVFAGLQKYNPETHQIEDDLGILTVSPDSRVYTVALHEGLEWHDSTAERPHYVTADDVLFTYTTIQHPEFPNSLLRQNFLGVTLQKLNDRTVRFELDEPYRFFASNLTLGLLPAHSFEGIPTGKLDQVLDFGFHPIGAGPYAFRGLVQTDLSTEVTLELFPRTLGPSYYLDRVVFRIFPDFQTLLTDIRNMQGVRLVPRNDDGDPIIPRSFEAVNYTLPQYVALFLNLESPTLRDPKLRLGLQLGTNKQAIADVIHEPVLVDTPLLEIDVSDWRYQFDPAAAQGALFSSDWHLPEKVRLQRLLELRDANDTGVLHIEPVVLLDTGASLVVTGSLLGSNIENVRLNGLPVQAGTESGSWMVALPTHGGTGAITLGTNILRLDDGKKTIDSSYLWRTTDTRTFRRAVEEQRLLDQFLRTRAEGLEGDTAITVADLYLEKDMLRQRLSTDPYDIRINDTGDRLSLRLLTSESPPQYQEIAKLIKEQWAPLGVHVAIEVPESRSAFEERLINRDYDVLLFGQSLLDNLDSYPYWHSAGKQRFTDKRSDLRIDAYNLSQYSSLAADALLEEIRETVDEGKVEQTLDELRSVLQNDVPAIFLYSPLYTFAYDRDLRGVTLGKPSLHSDRFLALHRWYMREDRQFASDTGWLSFFPWMVGLSTKNEGDSQLDTPR